MACRLTLLGPPQLLGEHGRLIPIPAKAFALAAYILLTSGGAPTSRAALRQFLWENSDTKTAATNLRKFLLRIRAAQKQFGFELIHEERDHVRLAKSVEIDLAKFLQINATQALPDLASLCDLYRGDLLEGLEIEETEFRDWLQLQRTKLRDAFAGAVANRLEPMGPDIDRLTLRIAARRLIEVEPYNESAHRTLMRLFAVDGERAQVSDIYNSLVRRLRDELGVAPDEATTTLFHALVPPASRADDIPHGALLHAEVSSSLAAVAGAQILAATSPVPASRPGIPKITVLPPLPIAGQDYYHQIALALTEDIAIGLCRFKALFVVAPHTAWELTVGGKKALFSTFAIDYAVETNLHYLAGELYLSARLLHATSREIIWTEQYLFECEKAARYYRDLSVRILTSVIDRIERSELRKYDTEQDATAYQLYLSGQRFLHTFDLPNVRRARRAFKSAVMDCPDFVPAISGLAKTFHVEWLLLARGDSDLLAEAERLARLSLEIAPDDARGFRELGVCHLYRGRFDESLEAFDRAEARNPRFADLLMDYADALTHACEPAAGLEKITKAITLNPLCPDSYWWAAGGANFHLHRYDEAMACLLRMRDQSPAFRLLAASSAMLGDRERATDYVRKTMDIHPDFRVSDWLSIVPIRDRTFAQHYEQSLREAGFD